jgi:hypothetical protein
LDLSNKDIGRATSNSETGTPIVTTAKTDGLAVPNSHIVHITNSITTKPIKRPFIAVLIIAPQGRLSWRPLSLRLTRFRLRLRQTFHQLVCSRTLFVRADLAGLLKYIISPWRGG